MRLADVLNLPKEANSLAIIKDYLETSLTNLEYQAAFNYYLEIADTEGLFDYVYEEGKRVFEQIEHQTQSMYYEKILGFIINACLALGHLDEAKSYIDIRKEALPVVNQYLGLLDEIKLKKALHEPYTEALLRVLADVVPDHVKIFCHEELYMIHMKDQSYEDALNDINKLYAFDLKYKYFYDELDLLIKLNRLDEAKKKANEALKDNKRDIKTVYVLLQVHYLQESYMKAVNLEAEYEEFFEAEDEDIRKKIYTLLIDLYKKIDNKPSLTLYQNRLKNINRTLGRKSKKDEQNNEKEQKVIFIEKPETDKTMVSGALLKQLDTAVHLIEYAHILDEKLPLREFLRLFFMEVEKKIDAKEFAVYINQPLDNFYFYKKERLYDKTYNASHLEQTFIDKVLAGNEVFEQTSQIKWPKNIITQKDYDATIGYVYALPIGDEAVFICHLEQVLEDPAVYYDLLKLISSIIFSHLADEKRWHKLKEENKFYHQIVNAPIIAFREMSETRSTYNNEAMQLFGLDKHYHFELFLRDVSYEYVNTYKQTVKKLFAKSGESAQILYTYQEKHILEKMYSIKQQDEITIISVFVDQTKEVDKAKSLVLQATVDSETDLSNRYAFESAFSGYLDEKVSFCLI